MKNVGILAIGTYLPPTIRGNDWWPAQVVDDWRNKERLRDLAHPLQKTEDPVTPGTLAILAAMHAAREDPFKGAVERRVMSEDMNCSDMELYAAKDAFAKSNLATDDIGLLLTHSQLSDYLVVANSSILHHRLGLPATCISMGIEAACNSFLAQYALAEQMIRGGAVKYALLVQSSALLHIAPMAEQFSVWFGDGATAVIVGPVARENGTLGWSHRTYGDLHKGLVGNHPQGQWYKRGAPVLHAEDRQSARRMLLMVADFAKQTINEALQNSNLAPEDVNFYATHQSTKWFRAVTQDYVELRNAKFVDTFSWTGSLGPCNVPFMLALGEREGLLQNGDIVAMHSGGSGVVLTSAILRWGK